LHPSLISNEPSTPSKKSQSASKKIQYLAPRTPSKREVTETLGSSTKSSSVELSCLKSANPIKQENPVCNIIFNEKKKNLHLSFMSNEPSTPSNKRQSANKKIQRTPSKHEVKETLRLSSKSSSMELSCLKSTNPTKQENPVCNNITSNEKLKTPVKTKFLSSLSNDKTTVVQFCTPKHLRTTNTPSANSKYNVLPATRTPLKRYFSDHALPQSTPDCFNVVHLETPSHKIDDIAIAEQTIYEGESSNLTVGIRIRPLNSK